MIRTIFLAVACLIAAFASASEWVFDVQPESESLSYGRAAGVIEQITSTFNTSTNQLSFSAKFDVSNGNPRPDGFWLAMNYGPNPKGIAGELAILYFDGFASGGPALTVYGYNGLNSATSYKDGSPAGGDQTPDRILSSKTDMSWVNSLTFDTSGGVRTIGFDIDATLINNHSPLYGDGSDWTGIGFENKVGIWFHPVNYLDTEYYTTGSRKGFLKHWSASKQGYFDAENLEAVPEPATMTILAGLAFLRRKKANKNAA